MSARVVGSVKWDFVVDVPGYTAAEFANLSYPVRDSLVMDALAKHPGGSLMALEPGSEYLDIVSASDVHD